MRLLYDIFFAVFSIFYLPCLLFKGKFHKDFFQRFGFLPKEVTRLSRPVWIHAVSVGEAVLAGKLAAGIKKRFPDVPIIVSTTTRTGNDMMRKTGRGTVDAVFYYPLDISFIVSRVIKAVRPRLYAMIETELWPNLMEAMYSNGIPVVLINGRISDRSYSNYRRIRFMTRRLFRCVDLCCMQSEKDAERINSLGASRDRLFVTGNMKFDEISDVPDKAGFDKGSLGFAPSDEIFVAGSTHFPEEQNVIDIYKRLSPVKEGLKLILVPRHVERAEAVGIYIEKSGLDYIRFSDILSRGNKPARDGHNIILVDTIGHLKDLYRLASVVFVGGSIAKRGGQNPIEAARWGKPVIFGPNMFNFREVTEIFLENDAAVQVNDVVQFEKVLRELLEDDGRKKRISENAARVIKENSGSIAKTVEKIAGYIKSEQ
jgi:3-deoxy-D-manno-octulosonic-acid transferase